MIVNSLDGLATVDFPTAGNYDVRLAETRTIERFHSLGQHLCRFIGTKERVYIKKNSTPLDCLGTPTWPRFHCFATQIWPP